MASASGSSSGISADGEAAPQPLDGAALGRRVVHVDMQERDAFRRAMAEQKLKGLADGVFYTPLDYCFAVRRVLRRLRPALLVVMDPPDA